MPHMICVSCERKLRIEKSGAFVVVMFAKPPAPYQIWSADLWQCPACNRQTVAGFGNRPLREHFQDDFGNYLEQLKSDPRAVIVYEYER